MSTVTWRCSKANATGGHIFIGDVEYVGQNTIEDVLNNFDEQTGCLWRVGKTSPTRIAKRNVMYECVHRPPTHGAPADNAMKVGESYMIYGNNDQVLIFIRNDIDKVSIFLDRKTKLHVRIVNAVEHVYLIGPSRLSFGCSAKLTFRKCVAGRIVLQVIWSHNHDLNAFGTTSRRDPAKYVKDWFITEYAKGVPAMKALRSYIEHIFISSGLKEAAVAQVLGDRFDLQYWLIYFNPVIESMCRQTGMF